MTQISDLEQNVLRNATHWPEDGKQVFHVDAYNLGKSLRPLLKSESASSSKSFKRYVLSTIVKVSLCNSKLK
jgi:hypothetical protein